MMPLEMLWLLLPTCRRRGWLLLSTPPTENVVQLRLQLGVDVVVAVVASPVVSGASLPAGSGGSEKRGENDGVVVVVAEAVVGLVQPLATDFAQLWAEGTHLFGA